MSRVEDLANILKSIEEESEAKDAEIAKLKQEVNILRQSLLEAGKVSLVMKDLIQVAIDIPAYELEVEDEEEIESETGVSDTDDEVSTESEVGTPEA